MYILYMYSKGAYEPKAQIAGAYFVFLLMKHAEEYCYSLLDRNLVHRRVTPPPPPTTGCCQYPFIHMDEERQSGKWKRKVLCLRKQRDGRGLIHVPPDPEFTARPQTPPRLVTGPYRNYFILEKLNSPVSLVVCFHNSAVFGAYCRAIVDEIDRWVRSGKRTKKIRWATGGR